jgi:hypothetical protein
MSQTIAMSWHSFLKCTTYVYDLLLSWGSGGSALVVCAHKPPNTCVYYNVTLLLSC